MTTNGASEMSRESREAAQLVVGKYGEPTEATDSMLLWNDVGPWKRMVATKILYEHSDEDLEKAKAEGSG